MKKPAKDKAKDKPFSGPILSPIQLRKPHPLVASMPPHLKDPKNYRKIQKYIVESLAGTHSHGEVVDWAKCPSCQRRFRNRGDVLEKLGFKSPAQYMIWQKIHHEIKRRDRLR